MKRVGILGLARREGTFSEVGLRSWEEAGCAAVETALMSGSENTYVVHRPLVVRSARAEIERILRDWCDVPNAQMRCHLILTVGGTGYSETDIFPEATQAVLKRDAYGIAEMLRRKAAEAGYLQESISRGVAGMRGSTLLINLPGAAQGLAQPEPLASSIRVLLPLLPALIASLE
ncbi:MAG: MogA/MoaB family molybdenum cofactor biosynthesis protein [Janthinobacterium lividum]